MVKTNTCRCLVPIPDYLDADIEKLGHTAERDLFVEYCGQPCSREFAQGHDAKLKGLLIRAHRAGQEIHVVDGGGLVSASPANLAAQRGWDRFLAAPEPRRPPGSKREPVRGTARVGRWSYPATVVGQVGERLVVEYTTKAGGVKRVEVDREAFTA